MELLRGWIRGWRVKPPVLDGKTGEERTPALVSVTLDVPLCQSVLDTLGGLTQGGALEVALGKVQPDLGLENTDRTARQQRIQEGN